ncbi:hypothetical protein [Thalassotalea maritima]|uniref:hypothetical protein n=1 Tax=Thalassotalea maritima TaxID=3242416 RepID=UPI003527E40B
MRELNTMEVELVVGGDGWDVAAGGLTGAGVGATAVGAAIAVGITVTAPVTLTAVATGAVAGAIYSWLTN